MVAVVGAEVLAVVVLLILAADVGALLRGGAPPWTWIVEPWPLELAALVPDNGTRSGEPGGVDRSGEDDEPPASFIANF